MNYKALSDKPHAFTLRLLGITELTEDLANKLFENGFDDCLLHSTNNSVFLDFIRYDSLRMLAVQIAKVQLYKIGIEATESLYET